jgi:DNA-directed RNA polymerase subunit RPC12/RpoP
MISLLTATRNNTSNKNSISIKCFTAVFFLGVELPVYVCPKCGRLVEVPREGHYYCRYCGRTAILVKNGKIRERMLEDALWWLERNYAGKKVMLNPVAILHENLRLIKPHPENVLVEAMRLAQKKFGLKIDWEKYEHYKRIMKG